MSALLNSWTCDPLETICANSYRNFHAKGLDYLCLKRSDDLTVKVYWFEGNLQHLPELVVPHDHRYAFTTLVLAGELANRKFTTSHRAQLTTPDMVEHRLSRFSYLTPLNGGDGFTYEAEEALYQYPDALFKAGRSYNSTHDSIHTLDIKREGTVALLLQRHDCLTLDTPTHAWKSDKDAPSLGGLYDRMSPDHARERMVQYQQLIGGR